MHDLTLVDGVDQAFAECLQNAGITTLRDLARATVDEIAAAGMDAKAAKEVKRAAKKYITPKVTIMPAASDSRADESTGFSFLSTETAPEERYSRRELAMASSLAETLRSKANLLEREAVAARRAADAAELAACEAEALASRLLEDN